jgi:hypothetical protein
LCYGLNMRYPPKFMYWGLGCQLMGFGKWLGLTWSVDWSIPL